MVFEAKGPSEWWEACPGAGARTNSAKKPSAVSSLLRSLQLSRFIILICVVVVEEEQCHLWSRLRDRCYSRSGNRRCREAWFRDVVLFVVEGVETDRGSSLRSGGKMVMVVVVMVMWVWLVMSRCLCEEAGAQHAKNDYCRPCLSGR